MSRAITRLLCLAGYNVVAFVLVVFFSGAGHGSYAPPAVLYSWGILPWAFGLPSDILGGPPFDMAAFVGIPLLYWFGYTTLPVCSLGTEPTGFHSSRQAFTGRELLSLPSPSHTAAWRPLAF